MSAMFGEIKATICLIILEVVSFVAAILLFFTTLEWINPFYGIWIITIGSMLPLGFVANYLVSRWVGKPLMPISGLFSAILIFFLIEYVARSYGHRDPDGFGLVGAGLEFLNIPMNISFLIGATLDRWQWRKTNA